MALTTPPDRVHNIAPLASPTARKTALAPNPTASRIAAGRTIRK
ncbi:MAG: Uncharacterised protein [Porticoccaceae bacterium UBA1117]|nr:MAG: Uncharacterised protein [Porticoccaceae bacterium UBA1117]